MSGGLRRALVGLALLAGAGTSARGDGPRLVSRVHPEAVADTAPVVLAETTAASADGRYVAFVSVANNLVAGQVDEVWAGDVFLRDRVAGDTVLVSHEAGAPLVASGGGTGPVFVSADGGAVLFSSYAAGLAAGQQDANDGPDLFLWDRATDTTVLVSHRAGQPAAAADLGPSYGLGLSADGRYVLFSSYANDLVPGQVDPNGSSDVFLWDRVADQTVLVSHEAGASFVTGSAFSDYGRITPGGDHVLFSSQAQDLVAGQLDEYATTDVFVYHRPSGATRLVSHARGAPLRAVGGFGEMISDDGRQVAFSSFDTELVGGQVDRNRAADVFLHDAVTDLYTLVSHRPGEPLTTGNDGAGVASMSAEGRRVAFASRATDLGPGIQDDNGSSDVYLFDRDSGAVTLVSRAAGTSRSGNDDCWGATLSRDGRFLAFTSQASDLVPGQEDAPGSDDVFLYDVEGAALRLVSRGPGGPGRAGNGLFPFFSADGSQVFFVAFTRELTLGLTHGQASELGVFAYDRTAQALSAVSVRHPDLPALAGRGSLYQQQPSASTVSDDGRYVVFASPAEDLAPGTSRVQGSNVYLHDRQAGTTTLVSHRAGEPGTAASYNSYVPTISADGRFVAFASSSTDLVAGQEGPLLIHSVFLYDSASGKNTLVSRHPALPTRTGNNESWSPVISGDGRFVAFRSLATDLVPRQRDNLSVDVFLYDRLSATVALVSHRFDELRRGTGTCSDVFICTDTLAISRDGGYVAYTSASTQLVAGQVDENGGPDVFLYERGSGINRLASRAAVDPARAGDGAAEAPALSADGRYLAFASRATDHVPGQQDGNGASDVFVYDRVLGTTLLASRAAGAPARAGDGESRDPALSGDGGTVAFSSRAGDLVLGLSGAAAPQVFVVARGTGEAALASHRHASPLVRGDGPSENPRLSHDGRRLAFVSAAVDLVPAQTGPRRGESQVFLHQRAGDTTLLASHTPGQPGGTGNRPSGSPQLSADGDTLYFESQASDLAAGDYDYVADPFSGGTHPLFRGWDVFVFGFNRAPLALPQAAGVREDGSVALVLAGADPDGDALSFAVASPAAHGTLTGAPPQLTYTPQPGYHGPDAFTFTVTDGRQASAPAAVALMVAPDSVVRALDAAVVEGDVSPASLVFTVTLSPPSALPVTVSYQTEDGTAAAGSDYLPAAGNLTFAPGEERRTVAVPVNGDMVSEPSETLALRLFAPSGGDVEGPPAQGEITDDDDDACERPPSAEVSAPALICANRAGSASVPSAGAGASYTWTVAGGTLTSGQGTPHITFEPASPSPLSLAVAAAVTNASGCEVVGTAEVGLSEPCYAFHALPPCRVVDTRSPEGPRGGPALEPGAARTFVVGGACGVPLDAAAVAVNVTATGATDRGNMRLFPGGSEPPLASVLSFEAARPRAGLALVGLGLMGSLGVQCDMPPGSSGRAHVVLDVYGYFR